MQLKILEFSDVHLEHNSVPTEHTIFCLDNLIDDAPWLSEIDIIFIAGDLLDKSVYLADDGTTAIQLWILRLLLLCVKHDIVLRVLEGTPSHDRGQSNQFDILSLNLNPKPDVRFINKLSIEYIEKFNIHVLYIPDEWRPTNEQTKQEVIDLLKSHGLTKVDYTVMHGTFPHQLPQGLNIPVHDPDFYLSITIKYIFAGHIHIPSQFDRILVAGSTNRICHNEEHDKGILYVESNHDSSLPDKIIFKVNKFAAIFKSISIVDLDRKSAEELLLTVVTDIESTNLNYKIPCFIRVECNKNDLNEDLVNSFKRVYTQITWTTKAVKIKKEINELDKPKVFQALSINSNTIEEIVKEKLLKLNLDSNTMSQTLELLKALKEGIK